MPKIWDYGMLEDSKFLDVILEALLVGYGGGGGVAYVPSLNFKYGRFAFWGEDHVPVGIQPIFMSFVAISSNTLLCKRLSGTLPSGFTASVYPVII